MIALLTNTIYLLRLKSNFVTSFQRIATTLLWLMQMGNGSDSNKPLHKTFTEYKTYLKEGKDLLIEMDSIYRHKEEVIKRLKEMDYDLVILTIDNISYEDGKVKIKY